MAKDHTDAHGTVKGDLDRRTHSRRLTDSDPAQLWLRSLQSLVGKERRLDTCRGLSLKLLSLSIANAKGSRRGPLELVFCIQMYLLRV